MLCQGKKVVEKLIKLYLLMISSYVFVAVVAWILRGEKAKADVQKLQSLDDKTQ